VGFTTRGTAKAFIPASGTLSGQFVTIATGTVTFSHHPGTVTGDFITASVRGAFKVASVTGDFETAQVRGKVKILVEE
jgi:hypothetical protein